MSAGRYAVGAASLVIVVGCMAMAAVSIRRRWLPEWTGAIARVAELVSGLALLSVILELLGTVGWFELVPILVACAAAGAVAVWLMAPPLRIAPPLRPAVESRRATGRTAHRLAIAAVAVALAAAVAVVAEWTGPTLQAYDVGIRTFDSVWYHLPWAASFAQTGHIAPLRFTDIEYLTPFYPATAEMLHGLGIVLLGHDTLSPALNLVWVAVALLAAWCVGQARGAGAASMLGVALVMVTPMMNSSQAGSAANDIVGIFFVLASVALVLWAENRPAAMVLGAVAAGLAVATKLSMLAPALALTVATIAIAPRGRRSATAALWLGPLVLAGGYWYARNLLAVGNPLPWTSLGFLPTPAAPLQQHTGFAVAHYLTSSRAWKDFLQPGLAAGLARWWPAILAGAVVGPLLCLLPGAGRMVRMLGLVALASLAAYLVTPETAAGPAGDPAGFAFNLRYAAPALVLCFAVLPLAPGLAGPRRQAGLVLSLTAMMVATVTKGGLWPHRHLLGIVLVAAALGVAAAATLMIRASARPRILGASARPRTLVVSLAAMLLLAGAAAGYPWQRHYLRGRYQFNPGVSYLSHVWALFRTVHHARVGIVGTFGGFFSYPLWGPDGSNHVQYIGTRGPHGSFSAITSCRRWREAINAGRYQFVVTTPLRDPWRPKHLAASPEARWTGSDPSARLILSRRATGRLIAVYRIQGRLNPRGCPASRG